MGNRFASGKIAIAECDRCGQQFRLKYLKTEIIKQRKYELLVCPECWDPDQPQLMLGTFPVEDPQALRNPRRDTTYVTSGVNSNGNLSGGSRDIQWGWNPVGGSSNFDAALTPNYLVGTTSVGTTSITTSPVFIPAPVGGGAVTVVGDAGGPIIQGWPLIYFGWYIDNSFIQFYIANDAWNAWVQTIGIGDSVAATYPSYGTQLQYGRVTSKVYNPFVPGWFLIVSNPNNNPVYYSDAFGPSTTFEITPANNYLEITDVGGLSASWAASINASVQSGILVTGMQVSGYDTILGQTINFGTVSSYVDDATQPYRIYFTSALTTGSFTLSGLSFANSQ